MRSASSLSSRAAVILGLITTATGVALVLLAAGLVPAGEASRAAPRWVVAAAGLMFALCGAAMIVGYAVAGGVGPDGDLPPGTSRRVRLIQYLLGLGIVGCLAAIATWIAFGPGPRAFTVTLPFIGRGPATRPSAARSSAPARCCCGYSWPSSWWSADSASVATGSGRRLSPASTCHRPR